MFPDASLAANRKLPVSSIANDIGKRPAGNGEPEIDVKAPVAWLMAKAEMSLEMRFAAYRWLPDASMANERGRRPAGNGEPVSSVSVPNTGSTWYPDRLLER